MKTNLSFKAWCVQHGIKQIEVADFLGISAQDLNLKINGKRKFTADQAAKLIDRYNLPIRMFTTSSNTA